MAFWGVNVLDTGWRLAQQSRAKGIATTSQLWLAGRTGATGSSRQAGRQGYPGRVVPEMGASEGYG